MKENRMEDFKGFLAVAALAVLGVLALMAVIYFGRLFMNATAPITVHEVEEGIHCAISSGGEAIDCWKVEGN